MEAALQPRRRGSVLALGMLVFVLLMSTGCSGGRSTWMYSISREFYDSKNWTRPWSPSSVPFSNGDGTGAIAVFALFLLPVIIDTAILPVTATHDLVVAR